MFFYIFVAHLTVKMPYLYTGFVVNNTYIYTSKIFINNLKYVRLLHTALNFVTVFKNINFKKKNKSRKNNLKITKMYSENL